MTQSLNKKLRAEAKKNYLQAMSQIPKRLENADNILKLQALWLSLGYERKTRCYTDWQPCFLACELGFHDSLAESIHIFLEEAVDLNLLPEKVFSNLLIGDGVQVYSDDCNIHFDLSGSSKCRVVPQQETWSETRTTYKIDCS